MANADTADDLYLLGNLLSLLDSFNSTNLTKAAYYEGEIRIPSLKIAIPPKVERSLRTVVGWAGTAVDVLEERLDFLGWNDIGGNLGLQEVYDSNQLDVESGLAHLDALIYGCSYICVGKGIPAAGEPDPLVTLASPMHMIGIPDIRSRRLSMAANRTWDPVRRGYTQATLYLPNRTVRYCRGDNVAQWKVLDRDDHMLGRVPVVRVVNRPRASRLEGRSEITRAIRSYVDSAVRTLLGAEVNREFYNVPQRWAINVAADQFARGDGSVMTGWEAVAGRYIVAPFDEENPDARPQFGQFPASSPAPYLDQVRGLAQLLSAEAAIPPTYLGFASDQAASADAIKAMEARLIKRAERRQTNFGAAWMEAGRLALLMRDGTIPPDYTTDVSCKWRDASTPTRSAQADEAVKLTAAQVLLPDSTVTYNRVGLSPAEQAQLTVDKEKAEAKAKREAAEQAAQMAAGAPNAVPGSPGVPGNPQTGQKGVPGPAKGGQAAVATAYAQRASSDDS